VNENKVRAANSPGLLTAGYILFSITGILPDPFLLMTFFLPVLPLLPIQGVVNILNAKLTQDLKINDKFNGWNIAGIVSGLILWGLLILGKAIPVPSA